MTDKGHIQLLKVGLAKTAKDSPVVMDFLEEFCGFIKPILSWEEKKILYSSGKRDVILTIKTIMREDISPEQIASYYKGGEQ
jgi:hypothetical protein